MKKIVTLTLCVLLAAVLLTGCVTVNFSPFSMGNVTGSGEMETFSFNVDEITEVRVEMLCNIIYYSAPSNTATFEIQRNLQQYISFEESNGVLTVRATRNINFTGTTNTPVLTISTPSLKSLSHAGAGTFTAVDTITGDSFSLNITGAANGNANLDVNSLDVNLAGAGSINLSGKADIADIRMAGAGRLDALELQTRIASINLAGVGMVRISCSDNLSITAGGVGTVEYRGTPSIDTSRGGLVTVRQVN